jgi:outer membrane receptor protein involved in Fe transport
MITFGALRGHFLFAASDDQPPKSPVLKGAGGWRAARSRAAAGRTRGDRIWESSPKMGFTRADAAVYYAFAGGRMRVVLNVENLFDRTYYPTADGNNNISPGAPRNARVTLTTAF